MQKDAISKLSEEMIAYLAGEKLFLITTIDADDGSPSINAVSWVKLMDESSIRFSVTSNSQIFRNITKQKKASFCFIGLESVYNISGTCTILQERMDKVPMKLSKIEMNIEKVEDRMFFGSKIVQEPEFAKTYNADKAKAIDDKVFASLIS